MARITAALAFAALIAQAALSTSAALAASAAYYPLPAGSAPHDVAPAPDGTVWFTGQRKGFLGQLNPKTGLTDEIPLGPGSSPHGVIVGPDGAAWVTDGGQNAIVRVEPFTKLVRLYPLPKEFPDANLNTATFDTKGVLWFTGQNGVYGRLDPATGKIEAWTAPKGRGPYGITTTPSGDVWYASLAGDHIARIDPGTGIATVVDPPKPGSGPRRIWSDSKGALWVSLWRTGGLGRYDPATKSWKVYPMPKSTTGTYSVYVDDQDRVWATDWPANAIHRFDPTTETFETFVSDMKGANVRQMLGRPGEAWAAESGTNRLTVVRD
jgi:virginiamycin B lyase